MKTNIQNMSSKSVAFIAALLIFVGAFSTYSLVDADRFQDQINQLSAENAQKQNKVGALQVEADNLQGVIAGMQAQIDGLQKQIADNTAKSDQLKVKITEAEAELERQRGVLGQNIKAMYLEGEITTLEMLASSKDLSDFVDKQQYRNAVKDKIKTTLDKITELKFQLNAQKEEVDRLLKEQTVLQQQIAAQQAEQNRLLNLNQSEQAAFNQQIKDNKSKIADLKRQQVLENIRLFGGGSQPGIPGGGGYPWGNAYCVHTGQVGGACYNYDWYFNGRAWDPWGYGWRNCTSWVAYKLAADGKSGFSYLGNAAEWPAGAAARGFGVEYGKGARVGDAAVNPNGYYGHVMYVEAVTGDGRVIVSDYNRLGDGLYRGPDGGNAAIVSMSSLVYIHF
jgi:surface antigen/predicted  nucleic acid-binding Zn-ribbon protein